MIPSHDGIHIMGKKYSAIHSRDSPIWWSLHKGKIYSTINSKDSPCSGIFYETFLYCIDFLLHFFLNFKWEQIPQLLEYCLSTIFINIWIQSLSNSPWVREPKSYCFILFSTYWHFFEQNSKKCEIAMREYSCLQHELGAD